MSQKCFGYYFYGGDRNHGTNRRIIINLGQNLVVHTNFITQIRIIIDVHDLSTRKLKYLLYEVRIKEGIAQKIYEEVYTTFLLSK